MIEAIVIVAGKAIKQLFSTHEDAEGWIASFMANPKLELATCPTLAIRFNNADR